MSSVLAYCQNYRRAEVVNNMAYLKVPYNKSRIQVINEISMPKNHGSKGYDIFGVKGNIKDGKSD
eukprot:11496843-Ditylum_brightwellii.AAC.1